jgi:hypothetical protein
MRLRLNNITNRFDRTYSIIKFAWLPVICTGPSGTKYLVWLSDYTTTFENKTNNIISKNAY